MANDAGDLSFPADTDLTPETLNQVQAARPELPPPTEVPDAMRPVLIAGEGGDRVGRVTDEAPDSMRVQAEEEGDKEVVGVPEGLETLLPDAMVSGRVHQQHA